MYKSIVTAVALVAVGASIGCKKKNADTMYETPNTTTSAYDTQTTPAGTAPTSTMGTTGAGSTSGMNNQNTNTTDGTATPPAPATSDTGSGAPKERSNRPQ